MVNCAICHTVKAFFNLAGEKKPKFCASHKTEGMVNVVNKMCENPACAGKRATFNIVGAKPKFCGEHALPGMINLSAKRCKGTNGVKCYTIPIYNRPGEKKGEYCVEHKLEGMVNVTGNRCEAPGCNVIAQFNAEGETVGKFCSKHREEGMIDVKHSRCEYEGCCVSPSYRFLEDTHCRFCAEHKLEGMYNGKHKKCAEEGCGKTPSFNYENEDLPLYCSEHKTEDMVDVKHDKCEGNQCGIRPLFNFFSEKRGRFCLLHKLDNMVDVVSKKCIAEWCFNNIKTLKYDGYCIFCYVNLFPDKTVARNYKTKENAIVDFVLKKFSQFTWISDKRVQDGCSRRRPDLLLDLGYQVVVVEIDENQHEKYDCSCENKRLMEISQDVGHRPIVFIRFNPDSYINRNNEMVNSCWKTNKSGIFIINKEKNDEWKNRLNALSEQIEYWSTNKTEKTVEIVHLYYNLFD